MKLTLLDAVECDPSRVSGVPVFRNTRVPIAALFENLRDGASIDEFLEWFPGVRREDAVAVLDHEANEVLAAGQSMVNYFMLPRPKPLMF